MPKRSVPSVVISYLGAYDLSAGSDTQAEITGDFNRQSLEKGGSVSLREAQTIQIPMTPGWISRHLSSRFRYSLRVDTMC